MSFSDFIVDRLEWAIGLAVFAAFVRLNDLDPAPEPLHAESNVSSKSYMGNVYSRTIFGNVGRIKEAYFASADSCKKFVLSNLEESEGFIDLNAFDTGTCMSMRTGDFVLRAENGGKINYESSPPIDKTQSSSHPHVATINARSFLANYQFNQNIKLRYFNSARACESYIGDYMQQIEGYLDVNMFDTASCHSTVTGQRTSYYEDESVRGAVTQVPSDKPVQTYMGTVYLRNMFGNLSREKVTYFTSPDACAAYVLDSLREGTHLLDLNAFDSATCLPDSADSKLPTYKAETSFSGRIGGSWSHKPE